VNAVTRVDGDLVLVASDGGAPEHPQWFRNLAADPRVRVLHDGDWHDMQARVADRARREDLWPRVLAANPVYGRYQEMTGREIPVVLLCPEPAGGSVSTAGRADDH
jgi:deazaflavin-dependent oxidoreductase (nitroreductase family)